MYCFSTNFQNNNELLEIKKDSQILDIFLTLQKKIKDEVHRKKSHHHQVVDSCLGDSGHQEFSVQKSVCIRAGFARLD